MIAVQAHDPSYLKPASLESSPNPAPDPAPMPSFDFTQTGLILKVFHYQRKKEDYLRNLIFCE
jgi:hypothetical protein